MGSNSSSVGRMQALVVGLQRSGKTFFLKKLAEMTNKDIAGAEIDQTIGYNLINFKYHNLTFDIWEVGGDPVSRTFWPTFYRNLKIDIIVFMINLNDAKSHQDALKEFLILVNEEELKNARLMIIFNSIVDEKHSIIEGKDEEDKETVDALLNYIRECPVHDYDNRVMHSIFDISKMKDGENKTLDLLNEIFTINGKK